MTSEEWIVAGALIVVFVIVSVAARKGLSAGLGRAGTPAPVASLLGRFAGYLTIVVGFVYALASVDVRIGPLLGALGIGGIALAFALQEILSNLVSGILLQLRRPFVAGDQIVSGDHEGIVEDVNLRVVRLRTFDGDTVFIPNSQVLQNPITNWTATPTRRTTLHVGVAYDDDLEGAQEAILARSGRSRASRSIRRRRPSSSSSATARSTSRCATGIAPRPSTCGARATRSRGRSSASSTRRATRSRFAQRTLWFGPGRTQLEVRPAAPAEPDGA